MNPNIPTWMWDFQHIIDVRMAQGHQFYVDGTLVSNSADVILALYEHRKIHAIQPKY
tara:strand:+ start:2820 stop:2990 length:171 start_codon:yes stop_codon:yes gene_type:complete